MAASFDFAPLFSAIRAVRIHVTKDGRETHVGIVGDKLVTVSDIGKVEILADTIMTVNGNVSIVSSGGRQEAHGMNITVNADVPAAGVLTPAAFSAALAKAMARADAKDAVKAAKASRKGR